VCPVFSVKLTSRRMTLSSNARLTRVEDDDRAARAERLVEQRRIAGCWSAISTSSTMSSLRHEEVDRDDRDRAGDDGVGRGRPTPCVPPLRAQPDVAADARRS
jgi:hypothetical protein